jgi:hypothetical protein
VVKLKVLMKALREPKELREDKDFKEPKEL